MNIEKIKKNLVIGEVERAVQEISQELELMNSSYRKTFLNYYSFFGNIHISMRPESYIDKATIIRSALTVVLKKAHKAKDIKNAKLLLELIQLIKDFEVEDDLP
ncbi:hypothetical protein SAMN06265182_1530 [Persephonella hydrogeniphila]|uniref:Uncharacterized protein n=1 Tax=Persephonella hydrogeniphila TaxID=198703 RepID=A0A285NP84_9AQUI|nr:hypothetical protein [Persephonella hydrogeniphila]SNZ09451.1 hypothetical protein SAMN06265182_1530 [Persephonella hydrogeniphila]